MNLVPNKCAGSAIVILFVAVILFAALSWAWMQNSRGGAAWVLNEQSKAATTASTSCQNQIDAGLRRLAARGCGSFTSYSETGALLGTAGEPSDGSCALYHPNGGGVKPCGGIVPSSDPCAASPTAGTLCGDGTIYVDLSPDGNTAMYTTPADAGQMTWNDGSNNFTDLPMVDCWGSGQPSCSQGEANTAEIVSVSNGGATDAPYVAGLYCDNLVAQGHNDWYLPSIDEMYLLYNNRFVGSLNATLETISAPYYWTSSEVFWTAAAYLDFGDGSYGSGVKVFANRVRCVRKD